MKLVVYRIDHVNNLLTRLCIRRNNFTGTWHYMAPVHGHMGM